jgi:serine/threonine-protein kinase
MRPQVGQIINNKYRLLRLIGDGGMGSVFEARHEVLGTTVALKFLHSELTRRPGLVQRFLQEARVSAQVHSPHVVKVTDVDQTTGGLAFIVMEYLEGRTLQTLYEDLYREGRRLSYVEALEFSMQMLEGVEAAHATGIVHRDLKPDNVMITKGKKGEPIIKLLDFGIAKLKVSGQFERGLTRPGVIMGTPEYMAPEQAYSADAVDARADIFSLAVMIFEMLAGRRPVGGDEPHQIASQYLSGQVAKLTDLVPGIAPELAAAVHHAMAPMAKDRFGALADFRQAIEPFALAARAPSAMLNAGTPSPSATPAPVASPRAAAASPAHPATDPHAYRESYRSVPKTIPPEGEPATAEGGFSAAATPSAASQEPAVGGYPATVSGPPLPGLDGGIPATAGYEPLQPDVSPRPGGTAVGALAGVPPYSGQTQQGYAADAHPSGTAPMDPFAHTPARPVAARRKGGASFFSILLLASAFAAIAVGGVFFAHRYASREDDQQVTTPPPPTAVTVASTAGSDPTPTLPPTIAKPQPIPPKTTPTPTPPAPGPKPTTKPSSQPPILPTVLVLPSALPFPLPFPPQNQPQQQPQQPPTQPSTSPTTPPSTSPSSSSTRPRIIIPVPRKDLNSPPPKHSREDERRVPRLRLGKQG